MCRDHWWCRWGRWIANLFVPVEEHRQLKREIRETVCQSAEVTQRLRSKLASIHLSVRSHRPLAEIEWLEAQKQQERP